MRLPLKSAFAKFRHTPRLLRDDCLEADSGHGLGSARSPTHSAKRAAGGRIVSSQ